jgi:glycosyltransferase involved in cell wall biosynthesis
MKKGGYFWREIQKADFVYVTIPIASGLIAAGLSIAARKPFALYVGGDWAEFLANEIAEPNWKRQFAAVRRLAILAAERFAARKAAFVVVHGEKSYVKFSKLNSNTFRTVPMLNINTRDFVHREEKFLNGSIRIISVGTLNSRKNLTTLLDCVRILYERKHLAVSCAIVGVGDQVYEEQLRNLTAQYNLEDIVEFHGRITDKQKLLDLYRCADVLAVPSLAEGFPRVIYEAFSQGCFVVANAIETIASVLEHKENALLVDFARTEIVADQLEELSIDKDLQARLREGSRRFLVSNIKDQSAASQLTELLREYARV